MKRVILSGILLTLLLSGCGGPKTTAEKAPAPESQPPAAAELGREDRAVLEVTVEGETEEVPAALFIGQGYSLYIPEEGWRYEKDLDDGVAEDTWESILNGEVELEVRQYPASPDRTPDAVKAAFVKGRDYVFEDLMGGSLGDPLTGTDEDGDFLSFMTVEGADGTVYVISWEYPGEAAEGFGTRLAQIANTFQLME